MLVAINFCLDQERRSATTIPWKALGFGLLGLILGMLLLQLSLKYLKAYELERQVRHLESTLTDLRRREAEERANEPLLVQAMEYAREIDYWFGRRPAWSATLHRIARETPPVIQFQQLLIETTRDVKNDGIEHQAQMTFQARIAGDRPEAVIQRFQSAVESLTGSEESPIENYRPIQGADPNTPAHSFRISARFPLTEDVE